MRFFKWLGKKIGEKIGEGAEYIGKKTGWVDLEIWGSSLKNACTETAKSTGATSSYQKETASVNQTVKINEILSNFSLSLNERAEKIEDECIKDTEKYFDDMLENIKKYKGDNKELNIRRIKRTLRELREDIRDSLKNHLAVRVSIDDKECLRILKMDQGSAKENEMKNYGNKVIKEGLAKLSEKVEDVISEQNGEIEEFFESILEQREKEYNDMKKQLDSMSDAVNKEDFDKEKTQLNPKLLIDISDMVLAGFEKSQSVI